MRHFLEKLLSLFLLIAGLLSASPISWGQTIYTWDGGAGTNQWADAANWNPGSSPTPSDIVVLDNSLLGGSYLVQLPNSLVNITRLIITPSGSNNITLILPATNTLSNALIVGDNDAATDDIVINSGGILKNSSTASSGIPINFNSANAIFKINNGGRYIHNTVRGHVNLVSQLSTKTGTETGIFEFITPSASTTLSLSIRNFGTLILGTSFPTCTFLAGGVNNVIVRGNLEIKPNVTLTTAGFSAGTLFIGGNVANSGTWNTSSSQIISFNGMQNAHTISGNGLNFKGQVQINNIYGVDLSTNIIVKDLTFTTGKIMLNTSNLTVNGSIGGTGADKYIVTNSDKAANSGFLIRSVGASAVDFPIGTSTYTPVNISNSSSATDFRVRVFDDVFLNGTSGPLVDAINATVRKTWDINPVGSTNATIKFQWNEADEGSGFVLSTSNRFSASVFDNHSPGNAWTNISTGSNTSDITGSNPYLTTVTGVTTFSRFALASPFVALPITLLSFTGKRQGSVAQLNWTTTLEKDNEGFEIERSIDTKDFKRIGFIQATASPKPLNSYTFTDDGLGQGNYYRLKQLDIDGEYTYSKIIHVGGLETLSPISVRPNPTQGRVHVDLPEEGPAHIFLFTANGMRLLDTEGLPEQVNERLNERLATRSAGLYLVQIRQGEQFRVVRLIKQ